MRAVRNGATSNTHTNRTRDLFRPRAARTGATTTKKKATIKPIRSCSGRDNGDWQDANKIDYSDPSHSRGRRPGIPSQPASRGRSSRANSGTGTRERGNRNRSRSRSADRENRKKKKKKKKKKVLCV